MASGDATAPDLLENIEHPVEDQFGLRLVNAAQDNGADALVPTPSQGLEELSEVHAYEFFPRIPHRRDRRAATAADDARRVPRLGKEVVRRVPRDEGVAR